MRPPSIFKWFRARRENAQKHQFETWYASLNWTSVKCPECTKPASAPTSNYCDWCGARLVPPQKPVAAPLPPIAYYEEPGRTTSAYDLRAIKRVVSARDVCATTDTHRIQALSPVMREIMRKSSNIQEIVGKTKAGKSNERKIKR